MAAEYICGRTKKNSELPNMFQRIQSVFMLAAMALIALCFFIPFGVFTDGVIHMAVRSYGVKTDAGEYLAQPSSHYLYLFHTLSLVLLVYSLISFKNRSLQIRLLRFATVVTLSTLVLMALYINAGMSAFPAMHFTPGIALFMPPLAVVFIWLANRGVKKDEELVRSVDRIR